MRLPVSMGGLPSIESWGRGISKMTDFWVVFRKDIYYAEYLTTLGLNERQVKAVLFVKEIP